eukprot:Lithocolla_globosa_v1_NODE_7249_length_972_cov_4.785169.p1 type:complete len:199 gc:universal NODE_7249_length_972_cov_4.785169:289-885(+)
MTGICSDWLILANQSSFRPIKNQPPLNRLMKRRQNGDWPKMMSLIWLCLFVPVLNAALSPHLLLVVGDVGYDYARVLHQSVPSSSSSASFPASSSSTSCSVLSLTASVYQQFSETPEQSVEVLVSCIPNVIIFSSLLPGTKYVVRFGDETNTVRFKTFHPSQSQFNFLVLSCNRSTFFSLLSSLLSSQSQYSCISFNS